MSEKKPRKILEYSVECPVCGRRLKVEEYLYDMPLVGKVIISSGKCENCGYKWSDVRLAEVKGPRKIVVEVEEPNDVNALVVRSSTASILIPELGVEITPGPASLGYITTIEGVLLDILDKIDFLCREGEAPRETCEEKKDLVEKARNAEVPFTFILVDPEGTSTIVSDKAKIIPLDEKEERREEK